MTTTGGRIEADVRVFFRLANWWGDVVDSWGDAGDSIRIPYILAIRVESQYVEGL